MKQMNFDERGGHTATGAWIKPPALFPTRSRSFPRGLGVLEANGDMFRVASEDWH